MAERSPDLLVPEPAQFFTRELMQQGAAPDIAAYVGGAMMEPSLLRQEYLANKVPRDWTATDVLAAAVSNNPTLARRCGIMLLVATGAFEAHFTTRTRRALPRIGYFDTVTSLCFEQGLRGEWHPIHDTVTKLVHAPGETRVRIASLFEAYRQHDLRDAAMRALEREASSYHADH